MRRGSPAGSSESRREWLSMPSAINHLRRAEPRMVFDGLHHESLSAAPVSAVSRCYYYTSCRLFAKSSACKRSEIPPDSDAVCSVKSSLEPEFARCVVVRSVFVSLQPVTSLLWQNRRVIVHTLWMNWIVYELKLFATGSVCTLIFAPLLRGGVSVQFFFLCSCCLLIRLPDKPQRTNMQEHLFLQKSRFKPWRKHELSELWLYDWWSQTGISNISHLLAKCKQKNQLVFLHKESR